MKSFVQDILFIHSVFSVRSSSFFLSPFFPALVSIRRKWHVEYRRERWQPRKNRERERFNKDKNEETDKHFANSSLCSVLIPKKTLYIFSFIWDKCWIFTRFNCVNYYIKLHNIYDWIVMTRAVNSDGPVSSTRVFRDWEREKSYMHDCRRESESKTSNK